MLRRPLTWLVVLAACGPAATPAAPPAAPTAPAAPAGSAPAPAPALGGEVARWLAKLDDPREAERAVTELEALGDPRAIPGLGKAWSEQGRPVRLLQAIILLARPGRWTDALPVLRRAIAEVDDASASSVDSALKAADALGEARLPAGTPVLAELAGKPATKRLVAAQVAAIRALGKLEGDRARAVAALLPLVEREPPPHPREAADGAERSRRLERFELALAVTGAAINALAELRAEAAAGALVLAMYRVPELNMQIRRALVASGPGAAGELRQILRGEHAAVNQLFRAGRLDRHCSEDAPTDCRPVSAMDYHAATALGGFHDAAAVPDLLAALKRPAAPAFVVDDQPGPSQHVAILDALRRIGAPEAAPPLRALWAERKQEVATRAAAMATYAIVAPDAAAAEELGRIATDPRAEDELRQEAAAALARLSRDPRAIATLQALARRYLDESAKQRRDFDRAKPRIDAADKELAPAKQALDASKAALFALAKDPQATAEQIRAATDAARKLEADYKLARQKHREQVGPLKAAEQAAGAYLAFARTFQIHIARVEVALRCKQDLTCFAATLRLTTDDAAKNVLPYIKDVFDWKPEDRRELVAAAVERAVLEISKRGAAAQGLAGALLDLATSEHRLVRQSVLLALPRIAKLPCAECVEKLELAIEASEGKPAVSDLVFETVLARNFFAWAGTTARAPATK